MTTCGSRSRPRCRATCEDLEVAAKFYSTAFELEEIGRVGDMATMGAVYLTDGTINVALIKVDDPTFPAAKPKGLNHIGFVVDDVDAAVALVESHGAVAIIDPAAASGAGSWETKMRTPDGVAFDLTA